MIDARFKTFITLIEQQNTIACAECLHITQPAVTQHIHTLEKEYNITLFAKNGRKLVPTAKAYDLYHKIKQMTVLEQQIIHAIKSEEMVPFNFAVTRSIAESILPKIVEKMMNAFPGHHLNVKVQNTSEILRSLKEGTILFAIIEGNADHHFYTCRSLLTTRFFGVAKKGGKYAKMDRIDKISQIPLFVREEGSGSRDILESILKAHDLTLNDFKIYYEIENIPTIVQLVEKDLGVTFVYEDVVKREIEKGWLQPVFSDHFKVSRQFNFVYMSPTINADILDTIYNAVKSIK